MLRKYCPYVSIIDDRMLECKRIIPKYDEEIYSAVEELVGAVPYVLVNDSTTGYGIFIENMLDAAA